MLITYTGSMSNDNIFPADKRATAMGICNIVARMVTIIAPEVNELKQPLPIMILGAVLVMSLLSSFSFASISSNKQKANLKGQDL